MTRSRSIVVASIIAAAVLSFVSGKASAETAYAVTVDSRLLRFDTSNPSVDTPIGSPLGFLSGLAPGQQIVGIDFQPSSLGSNLVALGYNPTTNFVQLYSVNLTTAALSAFGTGQTLGTGTFAGTPSFGFDFNPTSGGIRITTSLTSSTGQNNFRFNATGTTLTADTALAYAAGDSGAGTTPAIVGAAYTNNFAGATSTTLYGYDISRDAIVTIGGLNGQTGGGPNGGVLNTVGVYPPTGFPNTSIVGFDVSGATGTGFLSLNNSFIGVSFLYSVSGLGTATLGAPTLIGNFATGYLVTGFAVVPEPSTWALALGGAGLLGIIARRRRGAKG